MCVDMTKDLMFKSDWKQHLEFLYLPCNYIHLDPQFNDYVKDGCIADLEAQRAYLGPLEVMLWYNYEEFNAEGYNGESISKMSHITQKFKFNEHRPSWFGFDVLMKSLWDETSLFQLVDEEETIFFNKADGEFSISDSSWDDFPTTANPYGKFKFMSAAIKVN